MNFERFLTTTKSNLVAVRLDMDGEQFRMDGWMDGWALLKHPQNLTWLVVRWPELPSPVLTNVHHETIRRWNRILIKFSSGQTMDDGNWIPSALVERLVVAGIKKRAVKYLIFAWPFLSFTSLYLISLFCSRYWFVQWPKVSIAGIGWSRHRRPSPPVQQQSESKSESDCHQ
jgi:hypothetical protein